MDEACKRCKFWVQEADEQKLGSCRRYPPQSLVEGDYFPQSSPDDWCGEFAEKIVAH